eukprot:TRINITY_DN5520_c0_g1_i1.p1 TRINITY_DN5520_c0_g1~~TRINITY_DN5520_c0_g1_i1.p1  ORF type:complete len:226 (+),score=76.79 TRINITY_DN5520_c0_g1_i1:1-678(+)
MKKEVRLTLDEIHIEAKSIYDRILTDMTLTDDESEELHEKLNDLYSSTEIKGEDFTIDMNTTSMLLNWTKLRFRMKKYPNKYVSTEKLISRASELTQKWKIKAKGSMEETVNIYIEQCEKIKTCLEVDADDLIEIRATLEYENKLAGFKHKELTDLLSQTNKYRLLDGKKEYVPPREYENVIVDESPPFFSFFDSDSDEEDKKEVKNEPTKDPNEKVEESFCSIF